MRLGVDRQTWLFCLQADLHLYRHQLSPWHPDQQITQEDCIPFRGPSTTGAGTEWRALLALDLALRVRIFGRRQRCTPVHIWLFLSSYNKPASWGMLRFRVHNATCSCSWSTITERTSVDRYVRSVSSHRTSWQCFAEADKEHVGLTHCFSLSAASTATSWASSSSLTSVTGAGDVVATPSWLWNRLLSMWICGLSR